MRRAEAGSCEGDLPVPPFLFRPLTTRSAAPSLPAVNPDPTIARAWHLPNGLPCVAREHLPRAIVLALRRLHTLRNDDAFGPWLAMIARNRAMDYHRRQRPTAELPEEVAGGDPVETEAFAVLAAVKQLPEAYRETLILRLVEGMSGPEIASRTGLTPASVRVNLHRGMKQLREKLGGRAHE